MSEDGAEGGPPLSDKDALEQLKRVLLGQEMAQIEELERRLNEPPTRAEEVSRVLPDAILAEGSRGDRLGAALAPAVEESLQVSIRRNPKSLVEAISPIMGPAIRRSIMQAMNGMVQTLNQTIEQSFTLQGFKWRLEARRTGRSIGEIAALHTLLFQVEQVFLVHRETGLLLGHKSVRASSEPEVIGSMLVAIRDFVSDSFEGSGGTATLDTLEVGDRTVWVETGRDAILASVVLGRAPASLRETMIETLERIEFARGEALRAFEGDASDFEGVEDDLLACLVSQTRPEETEAKSGFPVLPVMAAVVVIALLLWAGFAFRDARRWASFIDVVEAEPGVVVTSFGKRDGARFARGLRDPLARDPASFLAGASLDADDVLLAFEGYESTDQAIVLQRAGAALGPPPGVRLQVAGDVLQVLGAAPAAWLRDARARAPLLAGIAGVEAADGTVEYARLEELNARLAGISVLFPLGSAIPVPGLDAMDSIRSELALADSLASVIGIALTVEVIGSSDPTGTVAVNRRLAEARAGAAIASLSALASTTLFFVPVSEVAGDASGAAAEQRSTRVRLLLTGASGY